MAEKTEETISATDDYTENMMKYRVPFNPPYRLQKTFALLSYPAVNHNNNSQSLTVDMVMSALDHYLESDTGMYHLIDNVNYAERQAIALGAKPDHSVLLEVKAEMLSMFGERLRAEEEKEAALGFGSVEAHKPQPQKKNGPWLWLKNLLSAPAKEARA